MSSIIFPSMRMKVAKNLAESFFLMTVRASGRIFQAGFVQDWPQYFKKQKDLNFACGIQTYTKKFLGQVFVVSKLGEDYTIL